MAYSSSLVLHSWERTSKKPQRNKGEDEEKYETQGGAHTHTQSTSDSVFRNQQGMCCSDKVWTCYVSGVLCDGQKVTLIQKRLCWGVLQHAVERTGFDTSSTIETNSCRSPEVISG